MPLPNPFGKTPDMRLKVNKRLLKQAKEEKNSDTGKGSYKGKKRKNTQKRTAGKRGRYTHGMGTARPTSAAKAKTTESPIALRNLLNELLPQQVAKNMVSPALRYQTGRFANSVKVEMVTKGPRGGNYIDYSYMKNPYQTFEPVFKQGSTMRDPRKIIGKSIREIATGIIGRQPTAIRSI